MPIVDDRSVLAAGLPRLATRMLADIARGWSQPWLRVLHAGPQPLQAGDWVLWHADSRRMVGRVTAPQTVVGQMALLTCGRCRVVTPTSA